MKVYQPTARSGKRTAFVQPGVHYPASHWMDEAGKPRMFSVEFILGEAEVSTELGEYMIEKEIASRSPLILPPGVTA